MKDRDCETCAHHTDRGCSSWECEYINIDDADDLIKRSDAIRIMACEMYAEAQAQGYDVDSIEDFIPEAKAWMNDAPSADRPQGEWLDYEMPLEDGGAMPIQVCSLCKTFYPLAYTGGGHRFCPNCGARMLAKDTNVPNKKGADDE